MQKIFPDDYKFFPQTWLLPSEYPDYRSQYNAKKKNSKTFIVKPEASCQGRGIFLTRNLDDVNPYDHYVIQRYLHKPFLIEGLKFDLRIYVFLCGVDPLRIYVYREGLSRFATE
jgi:tubulin polyglutamylase TTLL6/13